HNEPCSMAPDDKHDLISGTCSHLPLQLQKPSIQIMLKYAVLVAQSYGLPSPNLRLMKKHSFASKHMLYKNQGYNLLVITLNTKKAGINPALMFSFFVVAVG
ncbi:hypothetical protein VC566_25695, partial [Citrobacter freundii]|nr:hypothetical protein [Citrobacter freundii]